MNAPAFHTGILQCGRRGRFKRFIAGCLLSEAACVRKAALIEETNEMKNKENGIGYLQMARVIMLCNSAENAAMYFGNK